MASWVISECGFKPLPPIFCRPGTGAIPSRFSGTSKVGADLITLGSVGFSGGCLMDRNWGLKLSGPYSVASKEQENDEEKINGVNGIEQEEEEGEFDSGAPPPFKLADVRAAIPKHCWLKDPWRSMSYVVRDVLVVFGLAASAAYLHNLIVWPLYWAAQGNMFWALFVLGHDWQSLSSSGLFISGFV